MDEDGTPSAAMSQPGCSSLVHHQAGARPKEPVLAHESLDVRAARRMARLHRIERAVHELEPARGAARLRIVVAEDVAFGSEGAAVECTFDVGPRRWTVFEGTYAA